MHVRLKLLNHDKKTKYVRESLDKGYLHLKF